MDALLAEHKRLGCPLSQLCYNGAQARAHVHRLMTSGASGDDDVEEPPEHDQEEDEGEDEAGNEAEEDGGEDDGTQQGNGQMVPYTGSNAGQTMVWCQFLGDGLWQLVSNDGEYEMTASLPGLTVEGDGHWRVVEDEDGGWFCWQGGSTELIPVEEMLNAAGSSRALAGHARNPAMMPGMRLPQDGDAWRQVT